MSAVGAIEMGRLPHLLKCGADTGWMEPLLTLVTGYRGDIGVGD